MESKNFWTTVSNVQLAQETCGLLHQMHISQGTSRVLITMYTLDMEIVDCRTLDKKLVDCCTSAHTQ
jgi:hypothetical protein